MQLIPKTVTSRQLQRSYKKVFKEAKASQEPVVVMRHNQPEVAIISIKRLEDLYKRAGEGLLAEQKVTFKLSDVAGMWEGRRAWEDKESTEIIREMRKKRLKRIYSSQ